MLMLVTIATGLRWRQNYAGLAEVPTNIPSDVTWAELDGNKITTLNIGAFSSLGNCTMISVSENLVSEIEEGAFMGLAQLVDGPKIPFQ